MDFKDFLHKDLYQPLHDDDSDFIKKFPEFCHKKSEYYKPKYKNGWISPEGEFFALDSMHEHELWSMFKFNLRQHKLIKTGWVKIQQVCDIHITASFTFNITYEQELKIKELHVTNNYFIPFNQL